MITANDIIILVSGLIIVSYLFNILGKKIKVPSVLLLIGTGIGLNQLTDHFQWPVVEVSQPVEILGTIGLIMIVLEAALDLKMERSKIPLIRNTFFSGLFIFIFSVVLIAGLLYYWLEEPLLNAVVYATPLSIISSAIAIPSADLLSHEKKEFIVYESSFSDIIGIIFFNYFILDEVLSWAAIGSFLGSLILAIVLSLISTVLLTWLLANIKIGIKFFLLFAILLFLYASGKIIHLPSLLMILVFGMLLNNHNLFRNTRFIGFNKIVDRFFQTKAIEEVMILLKSITAETAFLIRTFFFVLFGYTIDVQVLLNDDVWQIGSAIVGLLLLIRFLYLRLILKTNFFPELFIMPRGLITILLFYSIPEKNKLSNFSDGILFFIVIATGLLMSVGLFFYKKDNKYFEQTDIPI